MELPLSNKGSKRGFEIFLALESTNPSQVHWINSLAKNITYDLWLNFHGNRKWTELLFKIAPYMIETEKMNSTFEFMCY